MVEADPNIQTVASMAAAEPRVRQRRTRLGHWLLLSVPITALAVLTRGFPTTRGDSGVFLSVAGRLLAGDKLYRDVFDNKDPLFYYAQTLGLWVGGWRGPFLFDIVWLLVASIGAHLLLREVTGDLVVAVFGQLLYPLLLTGIHYYVGYSETPGLTLLPLLAYLVYRRSPTLAGFAAATTLLLKISLLPVIVGIAVAGIVFPLEKRRWSVREIVALVGATGAGVGLIFLVLAVRGEAGAYLATFGENTSYSSRAVRVRNLTGIRGHLVIVRDFLPRLVRDLIVGISAFIGGVLIAGTEARTRLLHSQLAALTVAASLGTLVLLAETALWNHHLEVLAFPMFCGASLALESTRSGFRGSANIVGAGTVGAVAACCLLMSLLFNPPARSNLTAWTASPDTFVSDALKTAAAQAKSPNPRPSYFHLGANDEMAQGAFLDNSFRLACPRFHQYDFTPPGKFQETIRCMERTRPQFIAVTPSFRRYSASNAPGWRKFVLAGQRYIRSHCRIGIAKPQVRVFACGR